MLTVYVSIGNSDDKLTQCEWADYFRSVTLAIRRVVDMAEGVVHGQWASEPASAWQNACWCVELEGALADELKADLRKLACQFRQDSIAWAEAPTTEFLCAG